MKNTLPVSVLIMCQNEEANIRYALNSVVNDFSQVIVVDSYSTDGTLGVLNEFSTIDIYTNKFQSWADQRNWMLENCKINNEIVFFLDADEYVDAKFIGELREILSSKKYFDSLAIVPRFIFLGSELKYAYGHPRIKRIFRKEKLFFVGNGAREYAIAAGKINLNLASKVNHEDRRGIDFWILKHLNNAKREAFAFISQPQIETDGLASSLKVKIIVRKHIWDRVPLLLRPFFYFILRYFLRLGFLDGSAGFIYCFLHAIWYQFMIVIYIRDLNNE